MLSIDNFYIILKNLKREQMAKKDKIKWDNKYKQTPTLLENREPSQKLIGIINQIKGKKALEIACGAGRNSIYLAKNGFEVEALDISSVAIKSIEEKNIENLIAKQMDLENFEPKINFYDLIVKTNYLDRAIISNLSKALKKDGILLIETYMEHEENEKPPSNPLFLLKKGELKTFFDESFKVIDYDEYFNEKYELFKMRKQSIIVKKL